ncbi:hypothetical protein [Ancylomarina sp. 16SWW S1-10-2]|uniref:hypothetical protein n=1 Tax=Ancylomarina sp. 16SWW S1-10-2 TaxID=2499681 RepID=UPI0012AE521C|nr:hypothetical protein [Ancylomarina sp. 16SWW S1-10-2]MRT92977.1 hypothetical protein [Ancylomarina sp. 16SWW S1-10-2]
MKRIALIILSIALIALFSTSCSSSDDETQPTFDETLIIGKWKSGTLFEKYNEDKSGGFWNTADDVKESEAQKFTWTITKDVLKQIHIFETGPALVPKVYTITDLTSTTMSYEDSYGESTSFTKQ